MNINYVSQIGENGEENDAETYKARSDCDRSVPQMTISQAVSAKVSIVGDSTTKSCTKRNLVGDVEKRLKILVLVEASISGQSVIPLVPHPIETTPTGS